jgi:hypothetical protein
MNTIHMVDAHVHFWDPTINYYPWLNYRPLIPFRYGDYSAICRPHLPDDYKRDAKGHNVVKTVYIEAEMGSEGSGWRDRVHGPPASRDGLAERRGRPGLARPQRLAKRARASCGLRLHSRRPAQAALESKTGSFRARQYGRSAMGRGLRLGSQATGFSSICRRRGGTCTRPPNLRIDIPRSR